MLTSLKLAALMAITTSLLVHPTSAAVYTFSCDIREFADFAFPFDGVAAIDGFDVQLIVGVDPSFASSAFTVEAVEPRVALRFCEEGVPFHFDKCGCVATTTAAPPTDRPFVFLGKAEAAGAMESAYLAYTSALNRSLQHYIEDAARLLIEEARGSTERVCVVLVDLLRAGLNSELVDLEDFTDFYGKVIEELGCSDV